MSSELMTYWSYWNYRLFVKNCVPIKNAKCCCWLHCTLLSEAWYFLLFLLIFFASDYTWGIYFTVYFLFCFFISFYFYFYFIVSSCHPDFPYFVTMATKVGQCKIWITPCNFKSQDCFMQESKTYLLYKPICSRFCPNSPNVVAMATRECRGKSLGP